MGVRESHELKQMESRRNRLAVEVEQRREDRRLANELLNKAQAELKRIEAMIEQLKQSDIEPVVTEHALLRYLERARGLNLDEIRAEMLNDKTVGLINELNSCNRLPIGNGVSLVVRDRTVVSVIDGETQPAEPKKGKKKKGPKPIRETQVLQEELNEVLPGSKL